MLILLTQHKHNRPAAVNPDHIVWIDAAAEERANVYLSNGTLLQVKESVAQVADMASFTVTVDAMRVTDASPEAAQAIAAPLDEPVQTVPLTAIPPVSDPEEAAAALANAAAEHVARPDKPGKKLETK